MIKKVAEFVSKNSVCYVDDVAEEFDITKDEAQTILIELMARGKVWQHTYYTKRGEKF